MYKTCSICKQEKPVEEFSVRASATDGRQSWCQPCQKTYKDNHYQKNKEAYKSKSSKRHKELRNWLKEYKSTLSCSECGYSHIAALDFHHVDSSKKDSTIANAVRNGWSIARILEEIDKCVILCSNCHRVLHYDSAP